MSQGPKGTLLLTRRDVASLMTHGDYLTAAEEAFGSLAEGRIQSPLPMHLGGKDGAFHIKGASLDSNHRYVAIKLNSNFPENPARRGLPTIQGAIVLADGVDGSLLAVMDSIEITLQRTAAATALAARYFARPGSSRLSLCGCGAQGRAQLGALANILPLRQVFVWDREFGRAQCFANEMCDDRDIGIRAVTTLEEATRCSDVIVTCTTARSPFLMSGAVCDGTFIAAVGADNPEKNEIAPELMARSRIVVDVLEQCVSMGDLNHAIRAGKVTSADVYAELGDIVTGKKPARTGDSDIIIFDSTGSAAQDVTAAVQIYHHAGQRGVGTTISLDTSE